MNIKRVSGYQATDGKLFADKKECAEYQRGLNIGEGLTKIGERMNDDVSLYCDDLGCNAIVTGEDFALFVAKHANDIKLALAGKPLPVEGTTGQQPE